MTLFVPWANNQCLELLMLKLENGGGNPAKKRHAEARGPFHRSGIYILIYDAVYFLCV